MKYLTIFLLLGFNTLNLFSQINFKANDSINFEMRGYNSDYKLTLCSDNTFTFTYEMYGCFSHSDKEESLKFNEGISDEFLVENYTLKFDNNHDEFFFRAPFIILPIKNQTFLIYTGNNEIDRIKDWRDMDIPFPEYLNEIAKMGRFAIFHSNQELNISQKNKKTAYKIFK